MRRSPILKRQVLADLLIGKSDSLRAYRRVQNDINSPYGWVIDSGDTNEGITALNKQGKRMLISEQEFERLPHGVLIWKIADASGGYPIPAPDEE
jgi:hypothetical protein